MVNVRAKRVLSNFAYGPIEGELQHSGSVRKGSRVIRWGGALSQRTIGAIRSRKLAVFEQ